MEMEGMSRKASFKKKITKKMRLFLEVTAADIKTRSRLLLTQWTTSSIRRKNDESIIKYPVY
jgi:hypothetical protein